MFCLVQTYLSKIAGCDGYSWIPKQEMINFAIFKNLFLSDLIFFQSFVQRYLKNSKYGSFYVWKFGSNY